MAVYDGDGVQQFYYPNVLRYDPDQLVKRLASPKDGMGDALIAVKQLYAGAVARTQHEKNSDIINIRDFGAQVDGINDDTSAFQVDIDYANSIGGGIVEIPSGNTVVTSSIIVKGSVRLQGQGPSSSVIKIDDFDYDVFVFPSDYSGICGCTIISPSYRKSWITCHLTGNSRGNIFCDLRIQNQFYAIKITGFCVETYIIRTSILDPIPVNGIGISVENGNDTFIQHVNMDCSGSAAYAGIQIKNSQAVWVSDVDILNHTSNLSINPGKDQLITWLFLLVCF